MRRQLAAAILLAHMPAFACSYKETATVLGAALAPLKPWVLLGKVVDVRESPTYGGVKYTMFVDVEKWYHGGTVKQLRIISTVTRDTTPCSGSFNFAVGKGEQALFVAQPYEGDAMDNGLMSVILTHGGKPLIDQSRCVKGGLRQATYANIARVHACLKTQR